MIPNLVVGLGEVGEPLREVLRAEGYDLNSPSAYHGDIDTLHIAFRYGPDFFKWVGRYQARWNPALTIIHSTVPIGTTRQIPGAVHSPINGRRDTMVAALRQLPKWIGGARADEAADVLERAGIFCITKPHPETTEALKLLCLAKYGAENALARYGYELGLTDNDMEVWDRFYNEGVSIYDETLQRPLIVPDGHKIGGHCVTAGVRMLQETHPHPLLEGVRRYE